MKINKYIVRLFFFAVALTTVKKSNAQSCNQIEIVYNAPDCLNPKSSNGAVGQERGCLPIGVCVKNNYTYSASINLPGWTYNWSVTGPTAITINPNNTAPVINITWPQVGDYTLTLTATDPAGNIFTYCLAVKVSDKPIANFIFSPNNVCAGSTISFTNTTTYSGGVLYNWDFGDSTSGANNYSTAINPTHNYSTAGVYTVTLIAYSFSANTGSPANGEPPVIKTCCADTIKKIVTIVDGKLQIDCISTVCPGQIVKYTAVGCSGVTWLPVIGGTMISSTANTITIQWGNGNPQGQIQAQCAGGCIASVPVPIIPSNPVIVGNVSPCSSSTTSYSLPLLPGTLYTWTLTNTTTATNCNNLLNTFPDNNTVWINWSTATIGDTYQLSVSLNNKHICCSSNGSLTITPSGKWKIYLDQTICAGTGASLAAYGAAGSVFNWTVLPPNAGVTPPSGSGANFNPIFNNPGIYTVQAVETANKNCNSGVANPQTVKVTVVNTPTPGTITGPATVCTGTDYNYNMSTPAPSGYHYIWTITGGTGTFQPGNLSTVNGDNATINWTTLPGQISVVLQSNINPYCPKAAAPFNVVQATVGNITGTMNVCVDGTGSYTLSGGNLPAGEPITWSLAAPNISIGTISGQGTNSPTVLWHGAIGSGPWGPVTLNASTGCGNTSLSGIMIYPKFTFSIVKSGNDICTGGETLTATGMPPGATHLWSNGATTSSITVTAAGTYSDVVSLGGCTYTNTYTVKDPFAIKPVTCGIGFCNGNATNENLGVAIVSPGAGTFIYKWYSGNYPSGTLIPTATTANYTATAPGNYYCVVTYGTCSKYLSFNVPKICCPDINNPQITSVVRNSCTSYTFIGTTPNPGNAPITWDFGDGYTAAGASGVPITHVFPATAQVYCVKFCVGAPSPNPTNCTGNCVATNITVPIEALFDYTLDCKGCLNLTNTSIIIPSNTATVTYFWDFGDGNTSTAQNPPQHCYTNSGAYTIKLTITYTDGAFSCTDTFTKNINYTKLKINVAPSPVCTGVQTNYNILGSPSFIINSYHWSFGDGFSAYTPSTTHIYNTPNPSTPVSLTVVDELGTTCKDSATINVLAGIGPCTIQPGFICPGGVGTLTAPNISGATYSWEIETSPGVFAPAPGTNTGMVYTTTVTGFYRVIITGPNGCMCTSNKVEVKAVTKPKAIISVSPSTNLCGPSSIFLNSVNHITGYTSTWYMNGNFASPISTSQMPYQPVTATTTYTLILTNEYGCSDTCAIAVTVNPIPAAPIIAPPVSLCEGTPITLAVTNYANNITWSNGATTPSITVTLAGTYTATYTNPTTGCSSSSSITIKNRPPVKLFPQVCDTIKCSCRDENGNATLYAPLPLLGMYASTYNIQWYFNGSPIGTNGNNPTYSPAQTGTYHIVMTDIATGCSDTSKTYSIVVPNCDSCDCKESKWGEMTLTPGETKPEKVGKNNIANTGGGAIKLQCKNNYKLQCNQPYTINAQYFCKSDKCPPKVTFSLQPPMGPAITGNVPSSFTPTMSGVYTLTLYGWCNGKVCDSCIIDLTVVCEPPCDCKGSKWGEKTITIGESIKPFDCNKTYNVKCNQSIMVNASFLCGDKNTCPGKVTYSMQAPTGAPITGNVPLSFIANQTGTYSITLYGWCGDKICDSCKINFKTDCPPPEKPCCPYNIEVKKDKPTYTQQYNATLASQNFVIGGLAGVPITEVRAEVISYNITDNYNRECIKCQNLPYTWASIQSASSITGVPPKISLFNTAVYPFIPTGAAVNQNPREIIWNNGSSFLISNGTTIKMNFLLPSISVIDCCKLKGSICVKFTFRDKNCKECEVIQCFEFLY